MKNEVVRFLVIVPVTGIKSAQSAILESLKLTIEFDGFHH